MHLIIIAIIKLHNPQIMQLRPVITIATLLLSLICSFASGNPTPVPAPSQTQWCDSTINLSEVSVSSIKTLSKYTFPTTVTTLNQSSVERYDINGIKQVSEIAPNFYMPQYGSRMTSSIYVRGLGTRIDQPVVGLNVDNVPVLTKDAYDFSFPDIRRIEMVRGPQSTLYGRNTMSGVINIATTSPLSYSGVRAKLEYASANSMKASAGVYFKPSDVTGLAIIGDYSSTDEFFRNLYTGEKIDKERQGLAKVKFAWRPSTDFVLENNAWVTITDQGGFPYQSIKTGEINHNDTCFYSRTSVVDGLTMRWFNLGGHVNLSSISSFQYLNDNMTLDQDFLPDDYFTLTQKRHEWTLTQDIVATGSAGDYSWLGGVFGFYRRTNMAAPVDFHDDGLRNLIEAPMQQATGGRMALIFDERSMLLNSSFLLPTWGYAFYHKSQYNLGNWQFSAALRLAFERNGIDYHSWVNTAFTLYANAGGQMIPVKPMTANIDLSDRLHQTSLQLLPEIKVSYDFSPQFSVGAVWSKGYKAGGYNTQMFSDILQQALMTSMGSESSYNVDEVIAYEPEVSWNYELNFSARLLENRLNLDLSTFFIDCRNQQMTVFPDGSTTGRMMANAGRTRSLGVELAGSFRPTEAWRIDASYGLAQATFRQYNDGKAEYRGNHVPYAPMNTLFGALTYSPEFNLSWLKGIGATLSCRGIGKIYWNEANTVSQPFYATLGMSVTFRTPWLDVDLWGENLTDTDYSTFYFVSIGNGFVQRGNPRKLGVTLRFDFSI